MQNSSVFGISLYRSVTNLFKSLQLYALNERTRPFSKSSHSKKSLKLSCKDFGGASSNHYML